MIDYATILHIYFSISLIYYLLLFLENIDGEVDIKDLLKVPVWPILLIKYFLVAMFTKWKE